MTRRRTIPRQRPPRPPLPDTDDLRWVSDLLNVNHDPVEISRVVTSIHDRGLWLPDTPDVLPPVEYVFHECLVVEQPFLQHGREKTLKTTLAAHLAVCTAAGLDLFGHFPMMDKAHAGPVVAWQVEGGSNYLLTTIDKVCAAYGVRRRDLEIEVHTTPYPLNSPTFLYALGSQVMRLEPRLVFVEPLYLVAPGQWNGSKLTDFDVSAFTAVCGRYGSIPGIGHHDKTGDSTSKLQRASGVGPAEWAGQWWNIDRVGEWDGVGDHQLRFSYGSRGGGAGLVGLLVDNDSLKVSVVAAEELTTEPSARGKRSAFDLARQVLPRAMDAKDELPVGELSDRIAGQIDAVFKENVSSEHIRRRVIPTFEDHDLLKDVLRTRREHTVTGGPAFPAGNTP